jgi:Tfp pilus assembly protein PilO
MPRLTTTRLWLAGGSVGVVLLVLFAWLLLIKPQHDVTSSLHQETDAAVARQAVLTTRLAEVREQYRDLPTYRAQLLEKQRALPATSGIPDLLRALQAAGDRTEVKVNGVAVGAPSEQTAGGTTVYAMPITLTVVGTAVALNRFLVQLQEVQSRAVLVLSVNTTPADASASLAGDVTMTILLRAFVAPATVSASPAASAVD